MTNFVSEHDVKDILRLMSPYICRVLFIGMKCSMLMNERLCEVQEFSLIGNLQIRALIVETLCFLFILIRLMDIVYDYKTCSARRVEEDMANA